MAFKSISKKRRGRRVSITISMSDDEELQSNKRSKKLNNRASKTAKSEDVDYCEESESDEESEREISNEDKGIHDDSEDKMCINEKNKIRSRNPPKALATIMSSLTDAQIKSLKHIGFESFVGYKINRFPTALARWLLLNYDPRTSVLDAGDVKIKITSQTVHDIFGLPMGGKEIVELNQAKKTDEVIEEWRVQFKGLDTIKPSDVAKKILEREDDAGRIFMLNFLVLFVTQMMNSTKCGTVNQTFLTCIKQDTDIKKLDWCGYLLKCLKKTRTLWNGGVFNGPSTFLTVLYAQKCMPIVMKRSSTAVITKWTTRKLIMLQKEMIASTKKITDPDTHIETQEIIAAKTTPEKERMTKAKIKAAKNAANQSPIKAVNLGDTSGKASDGISNTPKNDKVTVSGLRTRLTMLEVLMDGIACDFEKGMQQDPGKDMHNMKLVLKEKLLKLASKMEFEGQQKTDAQKTVNGDKQGASRDLENKGEWADWAKHSKISSLTPKTLSTFDVQAHPDNVASTLKEHASVLPAIQSFDLELTPTPLDVNKNVDIKDVSNQEPMLENVPLTFTRISAKLRLPPKKANMQESATAVKDPSSVLHLNEGPSFDLCLSPTPPDDKLDTNTELILENEHAKKSAKEQGPTNRQESATVVKDPSSVLHLNEGPSFDLCLSPTPPDDKLDTNTELMLENELAKKSAKEHGPTNTTSFDAVPLSFAMPKTTLVTPAIERKRKNFDKETISNEASEKAIKKMKRVVIPSSNVKSPFMERFVKMGIKCSPEEELLSDCIFRATKNPYDFLFVTAEGFEVMRGVIESLYLGITLHIGVINVWSQVCNYEERLRSPESMRRLFCHASMINEKMLNETDSVIGFANFIDEMESVMKIAKLNKISNIDMVFFPVLLDKCHYYLLVFNLKAGKIEILDNSKREIDVPVDDRYGESFKKLKKCFIDYLRYSKHRSWAPINKAVCERLEMNWRTENNNIDCGIFLMRHMETYLGCAKNWKCGFKSEGLDQQTQINDLRKKYLFKILKSDLNFRRPFVLDEVERYRHLPREDKDIFWKKRTLRINSRIKLMS